MADDFSTIGASKTYSSVDAWVADKVPGTSGDTYYGRIFGTLAATCTLSGLTSGANWVLEADSTEEHDGTWTGKGAGIKVTGTGHAITVLDDYSVIRGLTLEVGGTAGSSNELIRVGDSSNTAKGTLIRGNLFRSSFVTTGNDHDYIYAGNYDVGGSAAADHIIVEDNFFLGKTTSGDMRACVHAQDHSGANHTQYWRLVNNGFDGHGTTSPHIDFGFGYRAAAGTSNIHLVAINNWAGTFDDESLGQTGATSGTLTTTGSLTNFDDDNKWPARSAMTYVEGNPATGELGVVSFQDDISLFDDADNVGLEAGTGTSSSLVPATDYLGNARPSAQCDVGPVEVTVAAGAASHEYLAAHVAQRGFKTLRRM